MPMTPRKMIQLLTKNGFVELRQRGTSHRIMFNPQNGRKVVIPMHAKEFKRGTEQGILKQAGLK